MLVERNGRRAIPKNLPKAAPSYESTDDDTPEFDPCGDVLQFIDLAPPPNGPPEGPLDYYESTPPPEAEVANPFFTDL